MAYGATQPDIDSAEATPVSPLQRLVDHFAPGMAEVNRLILARMQSDVDLIPQLGGYLISAGGKRLRPLLTIAATELCGIPSEKPGRQHGLAACVEFIHTATLLHDDVVDESDERRGKATANTVWSNQASVLVGDYLFSRAFQLMVADGSLEVLRILSDASAVIAEGEVMQLRCANDLSTDEAAYRKVIAAKTAALFAAACEVGPVVAERPAAEQQALREYGHHLGMAFQLADDLLDFAADRAKLGKAVGDDFKEGKVTLPIIHAYAQSTGEDRAFWSRVIEDLDQKDGDLDHAMTLFDRTGALDATREAARKEANAAIKALSIFPKSDLRDLLEDVTRFVVDREF
ncbi:MAG: polyprenyl synthetase family protein [Alphaproteobacteria bacterium]